MNDQLITKAFWTKEIVKVSGFKSVFVRYHLLSKSYEQPMKLVGLCKASDHSSDLEMTQMIWMMNL